MADPIHQFKIKELIPLEIFETNISYTNSSLFMTLAIIFITSLLLLSIKNKSLIPSRFQSISEIFYEFIANMVGDNIGDKGRKFFPLIFTLFTFLLFGNMLGMLPYSFTFTSHIIVTFVLAMFIFLLVTLLGIFIHGFKFFGLFVPKGVPMLMLPLMILLNVTHPPAGGNPLIVIVGSVSVEYLLSPVVLGSAIMVIFGLVINRLILKKKYPI